MRGNIIYTTITTTYTTTYTTNLLCILVLGAVHLEYIQLYITVYDVSSLLLHTVCPHTTIYIYRQYLQDCTAGWARICCGWFLTQLSSSSLTRRSRGCSSLKDKTCNLKDP